MNTADMNRSADGKAATPNPTQDARAAALDQAEFDTALEPVEAWPTAVDGAGLLDAIVAELRRFVIFPKWAAETLALWILHTYAFHLRTVTTYVAIESPEKECGKSTLLTVLSRFVCRPVVSSNISSSAFFRVIEELRPTFLIDEADTNLRGRDELRGILNAGYHRPTAFVWRVAYDGASCGEAKAGLEVAPAEAGADGSGARWKGQLARYSCWCPKAIAAIGALHETLASRCVVIRMHRKAESEKCERMKWLKAEELKRQCARFVQDHAAAISSAEPAIPAGLSNRAADIWEPLLALADLAGGSWPEVARRAAVGLNAVARARSPIGALLLDIRLHFGMASSERTFSRDLVAWLNRQADRPWAELRRGKPVTDVWLSGQLQPYGIRTRTMRIGEFVGRGYALEDFQEAFRRYIPRSEVEALKGDLLASIGAPKAEETVNGAAAKNGADDGASRSAEVEGDGEQVTDRKDGAEMRLGAAAKDGAETGMQAEGKNGAGRSVDTAGPATGGEASALAEECLECGAALELVKPGEGRKQTHCSNCLTPIVAAPGTSIRERCPECGALQPLHGYNGRRNVNTCPQCQAALPRLDERAPVPWLASGGG
jgi:hypothetical protein